MSIELDPGTGTGPAPTSTGDGWLPPTTFVPAVAPEAPLAIPAPPDAYRPVNDVAPVDIGHYLPPELPAWQTGTSIYAAETNAALQDYLTRQYRPTYAAPVEGSPESSFDTSPGISRVPFDWQGYVDAINAGLARANQPVDTPPTGEQMYGTRYDAQRQTSGGLPVFGELSRQGPAYAGAMLTGNYEDAVRREMFLQSGPVQAAGAVAGGIGAANDWVLQQGRRLYTGMALAGTAQEADLQDRINKQLIAEGFDPNSRAGYYRGLELHGHVVDEVFKNYQEGHPVEAALIDFGNPIYSALPGLGRAVAAPLHAYGIPGATLIESAIANGGIPFVEKLIGLPFMAAAKVLPPIMEGTARFLANPAVQHLLGEETGAGFGGAIGRGLPERLNAETIAQRIGVPNTIGQQAQAGRMALDLTERAARSGVRFASADPAAFVAARDVSTRAGFLTPASPDELAGKQLFLSGDQKAGYYLDAQGDLGNVFNNGGVPGAGRVALVDAIQHGAKTLDAFDGYLPGLYGQYGFVPVGSTKFVDAFAPAGWDFAKYGRPDIVHMAYQGGDRATIGSRVGSFAPVGPVRNVVEYDAGKALARSSVLDTGAGANTRAAVGVGGSRIGVPNTIAQQATNAVLTKEIAAREAAKALEGGIVSSPAFHRFLTEQVGEATVNAALGGVPEAALALGRRLEGILQQLRDSGESALVEKYTAVREATLTTEFKQQVTGMQVDPDFLGNRLMAMSKLSDQEIKDGLRWYYDAYDFLHGLADKHALLFEGQPDAVQRIIDAASLLSAQADWDKNNKPALDLLMKWMVEHDRPPTSPEWSAFVPQEFKEARFQTGEALTKAYQRLKGETTFEQSLSTSPDLAQKQKNFRENLGGDASKWTADTHDMRVATNAPNVSAPSGQMYRDVSNSGIAAAVHAGINPRELQAMLWVQVRAEKPGSTAGLLRQYADETEKFVPDLRGQYDKLKGDARRSFLQNIANQQGVGWPAVDAEFQRLAKIDKDAADAIAKKGLGVGAASAALPTVVDGQQNPDDPNAALKRNLGGAVFVIGALATHQRGAALSKLQGPAYALLRKGIENHALAGETADQIAARYQTSLEKVLNGAGISPTQDRARHLVELHLQSVNPPPAAALAPAAAGAVAGGAAPVGAVAKDATLTSLWGLIKSMKSTGDLSHVLRQAAKLIPTHPIVAAGMLKDTAHAFADPTFWTTQVDAMKQSTDWGRFVDNWGMYIADPAAQAARREEAFPSQLAHRIPLLDRFEAAYSAGLNSMRWYSMDSIVRGHESGLMSKARAALGSPTAFDVVTHQQLTPISDAAGKGLGRLINVNTGRGYLGKAEGGALFLNNLFFSPRNAVAPVEAFLDPLVALAGRNPAVAVESAKNMLMFMTAGFGVLKLAEGAGAEVEWLDPTSSDFMKPKFGDTRYDIWGGFQQNVVLFHRLLTAVLNSDSRDKLDAFYNKVGLAGPSDWAHEPRDYEKTIADFLTNKLHPALGLAAGVAGLMKSDDGTAMDRFKNEYGWIDVAAGAVVPITLENMVQAILDVADGEASVGEAAGITAANFFGLGTNTQRPGGQQGTYTRLADRVTQGGNAAGATPAAPRPPTPAGYDDYH